ncbi:MAG: alpha/beta hydrolase family protein [Terriglobia bacterium]
MKTPLGFRDTVGAVNQIAYMVTQTKRFKAVAAGAPVADMISTYDGIRWGTGLPRQFQYERPQSRIGGSMWQYPTRFIENSPVFWADRVQTPVMILQNAAAAAVPWYQGIEFYLALRRLGKEVYFFVYNGEPHGLRRRPDQKDYTIRLAAVLRPLFKGRAGAQLDDERRALHRAREDRAFGVGRRAVGRARKSATANYSP